MTFVAIGGPTSFFTVCTLQNFQPIFFKFTPNIQWAIAPTPFHFGTDYLRLWPPRGQLCGTWPVHWMWWWCSGDTPSIRAWSNITSFLSLSSPVYFEQGPIFANLSIENINSQLVVFDALIWPHKTHLRETTRCYRIFYCASTHLWARELIVWGFSSLCLQAWYLPNYTHLHIGNWHVDELNRLWEVKVRCQTHGRTKYGWKCIFGPMWYFISQKDMLEQCAAFLKLQTNIDKSLNK